MLIEVSSKSAADINPIIAPTGDLVLIALVDIGCTRFFLTNIFTSRIDKVLKED